MYVPAANGTIASTDDGAQDTVTVAGSYPVPSVERSAYPVFRVVEPEMDIRNDMPITPAVEPVA